MDSDTELLYIGRIPVNGLKLIKEFEGCYLKAYPDPLTGNKPITIGYGSTRKLDGSEWKLTDHIDQETADNLLIIQLEKNYLPSLEKIPCWTELNANQQGALLSFAYNLGANFYGSNNFQTMTKVLKNKDWSNITKAFLLYINPGSRVAEGLKRRRLAEANLFNTVI